jgi:hypothetical protein
MLHAPFFDQDAPPEDALFDYSTLPTKSKLRPTL